MLSFHFDQGRDWLSNTWQPTAGWKRSYGLETEDQHVIYKNSQNCWPPLTLLQVQCFRFSWPCDNLSYPRRNSLCRASIWTKKWQLSEWRSSQISVLVQNAARVINKKTHRWGPGRESVCSDDASPGNHLRLLEQYQMSWWVNERGQWDEQISARASRRELHILTQARSDWDTHPWDVSGAVNHVNAKNQPLGPSPETRPISV